MFAPTLLHEFFIRSANLHPHKNALICGEERYTYRQIDIQSGMLADVLLNFGLKRQDRVVIFMDNVPEVVISLFGILKAHGVFVILNGALKAKKLAYILKDSGAHVMITNTTKAAAVSEAVNLFEKDIKIIWKGNSSDIPKELIPVSLNWDSLLPTTSCEQHIDATSRSTNIKYKTANNIDLDLAALIYTSGSTGEPKGVMSTHYNMISAARSIIQYIENTEHDIILDVLPLSFDYGLYQVVMAFMFGGTVVLEKSFMFLHKVLERIEQEKITGFPVVPTILAMILNLKDVKKYNFDSLRYMSNTGAALPVEHIRKFRQLFPDVKFYSMFGLTECKRVCYLPPEELDKRPSSVGKPIPNCEVFIVDEEGKEVEPGVTGELIIRGANVTRGYWNAPELTAKYFKPGRFPGEMILHSGDYFQRDSDGYLYFLGRKDDMIKSRGERVSAKEVENVIHEVPGVVEAAVIGIPDEIAGQAIKAFIVRDNDIHLTEKDIMKYCTDNLEPFAVPKFIEYVDKLPKTPHGKIDKKALV